MSGRASRRGEAPAARPLPPNRIAEYSCGGVIPETFVRDYVDGLLELAQQRHADDDRGAARVAEALAVMEMFRMWRSLYGPRPGGHPHWRPPAIVRGPAPDDEPATRPAERIRWRPPAPTPRGARAGA